MSNLAKLATTAKNMDDRYILSGGIRKQLNKVFPTHWSFLPDEIALYSFIVLVLSGVYLTLFFNPSTSKVIYDGAYAPLNGVEMPRAYETALQISFEVRGSLFIRQVHHWGALPFAVFIMAHMFRIFFTGAFRKPREANWVIGSVFLLLSVAEGFIGYSLPDDLSSGVGLHIMFVVIIGLPIIGTWLHWVIFNGDFPGDMITPRLYIAHVLILPALLPGLIAAHLALVQYQKHTQFPGAGRTESNVIGVRILPIFAVKSASFGLITFGFLALFAGIFQINAIWNLGPYNPAQVSTGSQPDIYMLWTDGAARVMPPWELYLSSYTIPAVFWVALFCGVLVVLLFAYLFIEVKITGGNTHHNLLQRPRNVPVRSGLGAMALVFYTLLTLSGGNDLIVYHFQISLNVMTWVGRIGLIILPPIAYFVTYQICTGLRRSDRAAPEHGTETGIINQLSDGSFIEVHQPLGPVDEHGHVVPLEYQGAYVPKTISELGAAGHPDRGSSFSPGSPEIAEEAARIDHENHEQQVQMFRDLEAQSAEERRQLEQ